MNNKLKYKELCDAQGNVMAVYEKKRHNNGNEELALQEQHIYGSSRLGMRKSNDGTTFEKQYELTNHLGNVLAVISDTKNADGTAKIVSASDYYPFGMMMPGRSYKPDEYRYSFNTQEKTSEINSTHTTALYWEYDSRIGRRWNLDPIYNARISRYATNGNNPICYSDPNGDFKTKFGANLYSFLFSGEVTQAQFGERKGEWYVHKSIEASIGTKGRGKLADGSIELDEFVATKEIKWGWWGNEKKANFFIETELRFDYGMQAAAHGKVLGVDVLGGYYKGTKPIAQLELGYKDGGYANIYDPVLHRNSYGYNGITDPIRDYWQAGVLAVGAEGSYHPSKSVFGFNDWQSESISYSVFNLTKQYDSLGNNYEKQYTGDIAFDLALLIGVHFKLRIGIYK